MSALGVAVIYVSHRMKKFAALPPVPPLCAMVRWRGCDARKHLYASYCVANARARHVDIAPVAPQEIMDQAVLEVVRYAISPSWRISVLRYVVASARHCWSAGGRAQ